MLYDSVEAVFVLVLWSIVVVTIVGVWYSFAKRNYQRQLRRERIRKSLYKH
jgi:RsiW-degrading membrane proteinase PrsW (M82 family)